MSILGAPSCFAVVLVKLAGHLENSLEAVANASSYSGKEQEWLRGQKTQVSDILALLISTAVPASG